MEIGIPHPPVLYKYRLWSNPYHRKLLEDNTIYLSPPKDFEDKLDCNPAYVYPTGLCLFWYLLNYKKDMPFRERVNFANKWYKKSPLHYPKELAELKAQLDDDFNNHFGVLSLSTDYHNDYLWFKYADRHKGFCVRYDWDKITSTIRGGGEVIYVNKLPVVDLVHDNDYMKIAKTILYKEMKWEKEKEYRLFKIWTEGELVERNIKLPKDTIIKVVLGKNMRDIEKKEIKMIISQNHPNTKILEMH